MKVIDQGQADWQKNIFRDLAYIRKNLRYPWKRGMKMPLIFSVIFLLFASTTFLMEMFVLTSLKESSRQILFQFIFPLSAIILTTVAIYQYLASLKFTELRTGLPKSLNQQLVLSYLKQKHLLVYHHPDCPDIMQILSRPLNSQSNQREALIFIADEQRILLNNHLTETRWIRPMKRHDKTMAKELLRYIQAYKEQHETHLTTSYR
jgi:hypothetical protein